MVKEKYSYLLNFIQPSINSSVLRTDPSKTETKLRGF
jgi:hypothetical protein